jgi:hypothetical protein
MDKSLTKDYPSRTIMCGDSDRNLWGVRTSLSMRFCVTVIRTPRFGGEVIAYVQAQAKGYCEPLIDRFSKLPVTSSIVGEHFSLNIVGKET